MNFKAVKLFSKIDTVAGHCAYCEAESVLVQLVQDFYRCTNCGEDRDQYLKLKIYSYTAREMCTIEEEFVYDFGNAKMNSHQQQGY